MAVINLTTTTQAAPAQNAPHVPPPIVNFPIPLTELELIANILSLYGVSSHGIAIICNPTCFSLTIFVVLCQKNLESVVENYYSTPFGVAPSGYGLTFDDLLTLCTVQLALHMKMLAFGISQTLHANDYFLHLPTELVAADGYFDIVTNKATRFLQIIDVATHYEWKGYPLSLFPSSGTTCTNTSALTSPPTNSTSLPLPTAGINAQSFDSDSFNCSFSKQHSHWHMLVWPLNLDP